MAGNSWLASDRVPPQGIEAELNAWMEQYLMPG